MRRRLVSIWLWHKIGLMFLVFNPLLFKLSVSSNKFYTNLQKILKNSHHDDIKLLRENLQEI